MKISFRFALWWCVW